MNFIDKLMVKIFTNN